MSLSAKIREQIISSFRTELVEHLQTLNDGLLALEQKKVSGEARVELLGNVFRAAHSMKGAARAVGVSAIEQLAHALEDVLGAIQSEKLKPSAAMFDACLKSLDAIQAVQASYEAGETTPPPIALQSLVALEPFRHPEKNGSEPKAKNGGTPKLTQILEAARQDTAPEQAVAAQVEANGKSIPEPVATPKSEPTPAPEPAPEQPAPVAATATSSNNPAADETIRVSVGKLDALMGRLSELLITKIHAEQRLNQVREAQEYMAEWQKEWLTVRSAYSRLARHGIEAILSEDEHKVSWNRRKELTRLLEYVGITQERMRGMTNMIGTLAREYNSDTMQMGLVIDGLEEEIKRVRMLPFNTIAGAFARMVRDLAQTSGKEAMLQVIGGDVELDKRVLEQIKDPIIHLLRNAVDHGIETPANRSAAGKPPYGTITLAVEQIGKDVSISIADDGSGIDVESIRRAATKRGYTNAAGMTDAELSELIYSAGFSTAPIITDVSGRGVGLDIVRRNVETLHGRISLDWKKGQGSRFTLTLPLALTSSRALVVRVSGQPFAIPLNAIQRIDYIQPTDISLVGGNETLEFEGRPITLIALGDVLSLPHTDNQREDNRIPVVVLSSADRQMAFAVDALGAEQEVVIKGLGRQLVRVAGISGASVMGNGDVLLIVNVADLMKLAQGESRRSVISDVTEEVVTDAKAQRRILVVDDSITTRTLEKNILEAAGYIVKLANDGQEALNALLMGDLPDLVISDVQMPRVNGIQLVSRLKNDQRTSKLPVILVTSLDSPEDKAKGVEAGADAYIVKSAFDQNNLLETIEQLI
jgi:two-component system chemotaxis sensor kinase CheA